MTKSFQEYINEYKKQIKKGDIKEAYKGLISYMMNLRTYFSKKYPDYIVSGSIYQGYMDMTYFSFFPNLLKSKKMKIGIVFIHETCQFEAWLFGYNKQIQAKYWKLFKENNWHKYTIPLILKDTDYILKYSLIENPDFRDLDTLTKQIDRGIMKFIQEVNEFLSQY